MSLDYLAHLHTESHRFLSLLRDADPSARVPSCPDWDAADLLFHLGEVQWFWGTIVIDRLQVPPDDLEEASRPSSYDELLDWATEQAFRLHTALSHTDPATEVWMWADEKNVAYIRRRQAHEALIHRLDAELTVGDVSPLDTRLASDGVDEALSKFYGGVPEWGTFTPAGIGVTVETTDTDLVVPVTLGQFTGTSPNTGKSYDEPALDVGRAEGFVPAATVRGASAALDAWLWNRADASVVTLDGDPGAIEQLQAVVSLGIQ